MLRTVGSPARTSAALLLRRSWAARWSSLNRLRGVRGPPRGAAGLPALRAVGQPEPRRVRPATRRGPRSGLRRRAAATSEHQRRGVLRDCGQAPECPHELIPRTSAPPCSRTSFTALLDATNRPANPATRRTALRGLANVMIAAAKGKGTASPHRGADEVGSSSAGVATAGRLLTSDVVRATLVLVRQDAGQKCAAPAGNNQQGRAWHPLPDIAECRLGMPQG